MMLIPPATLPDDLHVVKIISRENVRLKKELEIQDTELRRLRSLALVSEAVIKARGETITALSAEAYNDLFTLLDLHIQLWKKGE